MSVTVEELLERSGINSLKGEGVEKTASDNAHENDDGLVEALRKLAEHDSGGGDVKTLAAQELAEKTAEIAVIAKTLSEIEKVASLGLQDEEERRVATFIKVAMDKGYSEKDIAGFLKNAAYGNLLKLKKGLQAVRRPFGRKGYQAAENTARSEARLLREILLEGSPRQVRRHLRVLQAQYGKDDLVKQLIAAKKDLGRLPTEAHKLIPKGADKPGLKITMPGGTEKTITTESLKRYGIPTGAAAGGVAAGAAARGKNKSESKGGMTVIKG